MTTQNTKYRSRRLQIMIAMLAILVFAMILPFPASARAANRINWKPIGDAILKITGRKPPKAWSVYQDEKKKERVLVEMDNRYLILDAKTKQVYEITSAQFQLHGKYYQTAIPIPGPTVPSTGWDIRDIGPAERIEVQLTNENISFDVELPHPLDLRTAH
ncbi:MAG TPA: hypothetical protein VGU63_08385 [Candidatus Acidoferrales bacterium]|nr:hypothetical protein [Candidatus Acidoferrales bacterium]